MNRDELSIEVVCRRHLPGIGLCHRRRGIASDRFPPETRSDPTTIRLQQCEATVRLINIMGVAKYPLALALSLVLIAGLLCSQICALNCAFYGCSLSASSKKSENAGTHAHCHQPKDNQSPQNHNDSHPCPGHFDSVAVSATSASAHTLNNAACADALIAERFLIANHSVERLRAQPQNKPDRSPPTYSVLRL